jgi:tetratricopeptide (TPR) repeat protein
MWSGINPFSDLRGKLPLEVAPAWKASYEILDSSLSVDPSRLAFGYGPENFRYLYDMNRPNSITATPFSDVTFIDGTSELINMLAQMGVVGILAFLVMLLMVVNIVWKGLKSSKNYFVLPAMVAALVAFVVYPLNVTLFAMFWVFMSLVVMTYGTDKVEVDLNKSNLYSAISSAVFTFVLVAVLAGLYFSVTTLVADMHFRNALAQTDIEVAVDEIAQAMDLNPRNPNYPRAMSTVLLTAIDQELKSGKSPEEVNANVQRMMALSVEAAKIATDGDPLNSQNWLNRGYVYENLLGLIDGAGTWAVRSYDESLKLKPDDPFALTRIGRTYYREADMLAGLLFNIRRDDPRYAQVAEAIVNNLAEAENKFKRALELNSIYGIAIYNLGAVYERQGKLAEAAQQLETYKLIRPNDPGLAFELALLRYRLDQKQEAFDELQRAVALFPDYSNARWYLALIYEEFDMLDNAIAELERVLELNPGHQVVIQKLNQLRVGETTIPPDEITDLEPLEEN